MTGNLKDLECCFNSFTGKSQDIHRTAVSVQIVS